MDKVDAIKVDSYNLPIKIIHNFPYEKEQTLEEKFKVVTDNLVKIKELGFGGVVSNAPFGEAAKGGEDFESEGDYDTYLKDENDFKILRHILSECERLGLRFWLYDEQGYPSGGAGGMTYDANPEFECRALSIVEKPLGANEEVTISLPIGYEAFISAFVYNTESDIHGIKDFTPVYSVECYKSTDAITLKNPTDKKAVATAFVIKHAFEHTHAQCNVFAARRYLDVGNKEAVREFINNTYEVYYREIGNRFNTKDLGGKKPSIGSVEAVFTDEPSYQGCNMHKLGVGKKVRHPAIPNAELLPVVNWSRGLDEEFYKLHGYSCLDKLIYCFAGDNEEAKAFRLDFYRTTSYLIETAFFKQIGEWCAEHNLNFSGHVLLEDELLYHPTFEGNYFDLLRHMHYPGIDMLHSLSDWIYDRFIFTPKLISSVAIANDRQHVMDEVSMHTQTALKMDVSIEEMYSSICLQYSLGADVFTYYYPTDFMEKGEYLRHNLAHGRIDEIMSGETVSDVLTYYPIETVQMYHKGGIDHAGVYGEQEQACWNSVKTLAVELTTKQVGFEYADFNLLSKCIVKDGKIITENGRVYNAITFPAMEYTDELKAVIKNIVELGGVVKGVKSKLFKTPKTVRAYSNERKLVKALDRTDFTVLKTNNKNRLSILTRDTVRGKAMLLVNCDNEPNKVKLTINGFKDPVLYSPLLDSFVSAKFSVKNDTSIAEFTIDRKDALIIMEN